MSGLTMIVIGLVLGLAGGWSIRTVLMLVGFGAGWLLANVFDANLLVTLVIALAGALFAWLVLRLAATIVFFAVGAFVGLLVGARLFRLLEGGDGNLLLAVVFIPAVTLAGGWLAEKTRDGFVAWGTSIAGAALVLAGLGVLVSGLAWLRDPSQAWEAAVGAVVWVALSVFFRFAQRAVGSSDRG
ncbi:MAG TPA: hypothetical protein VNN23_08500 [Ornithinibacter sp.]|jgi:hypothetical protein|nr:hypothetical protein [Ornithinibacter sp.]